MSLETAKMRTPKLGDYLLWASSGNALNHKTGRRHEGHFLRVFVVEVGAFQCKVKSDIGLHSANLRSLYWPGPLHQWISDNFRRDIARANEVPDSSRPELSKAQQ